MSETISLEQLGAEIVARIEAAKKARDKALDHELAAGLRLIEARERTGATFPEFLQKFCPNLKKSRAYQLIRIAGGKTTVEAERTKTAERVRKHRAAKAEAPKTAPTDCPLHNGQATGETAQVKKDSPERLLSARNVGFHKDLRDGYQRTLCVMTKVHTVICQIQAPSRACPTGKCVEGCFVISEDNVLILTDRAGEPAVDAAGRQYTHTLGPNEEARPIARRLTKELRSALRGGGAPRAGFDGPIEYFDRGKI